MTESVNTKAEIEVGSKVKLRGRQTRGVSFKVLSIDRWGDCKDTTQFEWVSV